MNWLDIEDIAESLHDAYPHVDVLSLRFLELRNMIIALDGFVGDLNSCNEKILEAIQSEWIDIKK